MTPYKHSFVIQKGKMLFFLYYAFILFCFFPFIQIFPLGTDSQPNAFLVGLVIFTLSPDFKIDKNSALLLFLFLSAVVIVFFSAISFSSFRYLFNYFSLFFLSVISFRILDALNGIPYKLYRAAVYVWFIVGLIQITIYPSFLSFLIPRGNSATSLLTGRGIVCLAPEPTFYGIMCLLFIMIGFFNFKHNSGIKWLQLLLLVQLFLFSVSSMCIFLLLFSSIIFGIYKIATLKNYKIIFYTFFFILVLYFLLPFILDYFKGYRFGILLKRLWYNPLTFITIDGSVNERFNHVFFPLYGFVENYGLPHGFDSFEGFMNKCIGLRKFQGYFSDYFIYRASYHRIMSAIGGAFFELGILAFIIIIVIFRAFKPLIQINKNNAFFLILYLGILMNAITFSNAIIPFVVGNLFFLGKKLSVNSN